MKCESSIISRNPLTTVADGHLVINVWGKKKLGICWNVVRATNKQPQCGATIFDVHMYDYQTSGNQNQTYIPPGGSTYLQRPIH